MKNVFSGGCVVLTTDTSEKQFSAKTKERWGGRKVGNAYRTAK
jgi:hypothetical protein